MALMNTDSAGSKIQSLKISFILTCLLDIKLTKKVTAWYGQPPEHKYQFFPFP